MVVVERCSIPRSAALHLAVLWRAPVTQVSALTNITAATKAVVITLVLWRSLGCA